MSLTSAKEMGFRGSDTVILLPIHNSYALWFGQSKSFVLLQEPAFEVYRLFSEGNPILKIKEICLDKFGHLEEDIPRFVDEIIRYMLYFSNPKNAPMISVADQLPFVPQCNEFCTSVDYQFGQSQIRIKYQAEYLKFAIHPLISHLETVADSAPKNILECFEQDQLLLLKSNEKLTSAFDP